MGGIEGIMALVIGIVVVLFVPALVWATVTAGLVQIVRGKYGRSAPPKPSWSRKRSSR